jgi:hypothetical protein
MADLTQGNGEIPFKYKVVTPEINQPEVNQNVSPDFKYKVTSEAPPSLADTGMDVVKSFGSRLVKGATSFADLPSNLLQGGMRMAERATGYDIPEFAERSMLATMPGGMSRVINGETTKEAMTRNFPSVMGYESKTTPGKYAGAVGEFIPGAMAGPGGIARNIITGAVLPALGSEFLGQTFEGSSNKYVEPAARLAGAILGGFGSNIVEGMGRRLISPGGGAAPELLAAADTLKKAGVNVTAGQKTGSPSILAAEGDTALGQAFFGAAPNSPQMQQFTEASMRTLGSNAKLATQDAMDEAKDDIVKRMNDSVAGIDVRPTFSLIDDIFKIKKDYIANTNKTVRPEIIENIANEVNNAARTGQPISATQMAEWRRNLGQQLYSNDNFVADAAYSMRSSLDDAIENSMMAVGQPERMTAWRQSRDQYRNFLAMEDALKPNKARGIMGIVTPQDLINAVTKQDRRGVITGKRGEISDLAQSGVLAAKPLPAPRGNQALRGSLSLPLAEGLSSIPAAIGAVQAASYLGLGPVGTALTTLGAVGIPIADAARRLVMQQAMRPTVQKYLGNQLVNRQIPSSAVAPAVRGAASSLYLDREGRKSGGRVSSHEMAADQLVRAAERAKRGLSAHTEGLLNTPDESVASALEIANRSI